MGYSIDGATKVISLTTGTTLMSVRDLWSRWVDWWLTSDNSKYPVAMLCIGGDDIDVSAGTKIPIYVFLLNGWVIKPQEDDHTLKVTDGILIGSEGGDPFTNTSGNYVVRINYQQPVQAISFSAEGGSGATPEEIWSYATRELSSGGNSDVANAVANTTIDILTIKEVLKVLLAHAAGEASGGGTNTIKFRDQADTKDVITAVVDENGNRSVVVLDPD